MVRVKYEKGGGMKFKILILCVGIAIGIFIGVFVWRNDVIAKATHTVLCIIRGSQQFIQCDASVIDHGKGVAAYNRACCEEASKNADMKAVALPPHTTKSTVIASTPQAAGKTARDLLKH